MTTHHPHRRGAGVPAVHVRPRAPGHRRDRRPGPRQPGRAQHADRRRARRRQVQRRCNLIVAHGALSADCGLVLVDGKQVELGLWRHCADVFVGPSHRRRHRRVHRLQQIMNDRYERLLASGRRKITRDDGRAGLPGRHRRVRLLLGHRRAPRPSEPSSPPCPRPRRPRPRRRRHPHPGHPAAIPPGHRPIPAGPVRLPVGVPLHHRRLLRRASSARAGPPQGYTAAEHRPARPRRVLAAVRDRRPPPDQDRLPDRRPDRHLAA